ncbi:MAG: geranylgeranyl reductase family protein [Desulfomonilaceae bacterium]
MGELSRCDVLVVGAGPAGSMAAARTASAGIPTLLIDAKRRIGAPPHCGEFVPARIFAEFDISRSPIIQKILNMETVILDKDAIRAPQGESSAQDCNRVDDLSLGLSTAAPPTQTPSPGFMIDRVRFDRELAHRAAQQGATVLCDTKLIAKDGDQWALRKGAMVWSVKPRRVIAADGAASTVARLLRLPPQKFQIGVQVEVPLVQPSSNTVVFLHKSFVGGYGWVFPKGLAANVGVGVEPRPEARPWAVLRAFVEYLQRRHIIRRGVLATSCGLIPVSGPRPSLFSQNVLFCGDAAGLTHPITGAGVSQALISGDLAGRLIAAAITGGAADAAEAYDAEMKKHFGNVLQHALSKRRDMTTRWDRCDFEALCRDCWIAYKGYKKRIARAKNPAEEIHA